MMIRIAIWITVFLTVLKLVDAINWPWSWIFVPVLSVLFAFVIFLSIAIASELINR